MQEGFHGQTSWGKYVTLVENAYSYIYIKVSKKIGNIKNYFTFFKPTLSKLI